MRVEHRFVQNLVHWNSQRLPQQNPGSINFVLLHIHKGFKLGKFYLDNDLFYQHVSNEDVVHRPKFWLIHSFYFQDQVFKGVLKSRIGFDLRYNTPYFLPGYFPMTGQFLVNAEDQHVAHPLIDVFINFSVKTVRIYFKVNYVNQGIFENGIYNAQNYPARDRSFTGGVKWRFLE